MPFHPFILFILFIMVSNSNICEKISYFDYFAQFFIIFTKTAFFHLLPNALHAWSLEKHCQPNKNTNMFAVPHSGRIYGQLVKCPEIAKFHKLKNKTPEFNYEYNGGPFFDFQMNKLEINKHAVQTYED